MNHPLLIPATEEPQLLLGNEAIVRGALEAGVTVISCYPGTPSSEVPDTFRRLKAKDRYRLEYSVNEKVAMEIAAGAALAGAMSMVTMKHVGLNVAADPLMTMSYLGLPGGLLLLSADDPGCHSSQNEQDNRHYARFAGLPCFEPADAQEAKDMTVTALLLARELEQPVMLRTTTRLNHLRGPVYFGALPEKAAPLVPVAKDPLRFVAVPAVARTRHHALETALTKARELAEQSPWNRVHGEGRIGVVASGVARDYLEDALYEGGWNDRVKIFDLGMSWPLPVRSLTAFLASCDKVLVLEEGAPLLENDLRALAQQAGLTVRIDGKNSDTLTIYGEYATSTVRAALAAFLEEPSPATPVVSPVESSLPGRPPNLCPGCSHRAVYYAVRTVFGDSASYAGDIGCYVLGIMPPLRMADFLICMGASISAGSGFSAASGRPVVAFIGDSTFFHSGMTGLANAVFNQHNLLLIILDNGTTAMTGHQPNPGMRQDMLGDDASHLDIEAIVRALGVQHVEKVKAYNLRATITALTTLKDLSGVRVLIAEEPCVLYAHRSLKKISPQRATVIQQGPEALHCLKTLACPAFIHNGDTVTVDETLCAGCMVCLQVAPTAFKAVRRSAK